MHVNGQLLLLPQNPGVKKWFGIPDTLGTQILPLIERGVKVLAQDIMMWADTMGHGATEIAPYRERCPLKLSLIERGVH